MRQMARERFSSFVLDVDGLVEQPVTPNARGTPTLAEADADHQTLLHPGMVRRRQLGGVSLGDIVRHCRPLAAARYVVFYALDDKSTSEPDPAGPGCFYGTIDIALASHPQTILAYEMNDSPLPVPHGAPLRLRVETQLGFTMVKYVRRIEFVHDYRHIGAGQGGGARISSTTARRLGSEIGTAASTTGLRLSSTA